MPKEERQIAGLAAHLDLDRGRRVEIFDLYAPKARLGDLTVRNVALAVEIVPRHADKIADARGSPLDSDASISHEWRPMTCQTRCNAGLSASGAPSLANSLMI